MKEIVDVKEIYEGLFSKDRYDKIVGWNRKQGDDRTFEAVWPINDDCLSLRHWEQFLIERTDDFLNIKFSSMYNRKEVKTEFYKLKDYVYVVCEALYWREE